MEVVHLPSAPPVAVPAGWESEAEIGGVMVATPCYGGMVTSPYLDSALGTACELGRQGIAYQWVSVYGESLIHRARNHLAARFLAWPGGTHLIFIDADISWEPGDITRLLAHDVPLVCGVYPKKKYPIEYAFHPLTDDEGRSIRDPRTGRIKIANAATGFLCIKREVFERLKSVCAKIVHANECPSDHLPHLFNFFPAEVEDGILMSEDYGFSRRWRSVGGEVWMDPAIKLTHFGAHPFEGDPTRIYRLADEGETSAAA